MKFYEVGGAVRDHLMGITSKDVDFAVEVESFAVMKSELQKRGFTIYLASPEYLTVRAQVPKDIALFGRAKVADFVMCRKDGPTKDGRRPEYVEPGTIFDDLARRDFTINAVARDVETGAIIDPHGGVDDIKSRTLRFVGDPSQRISEDGLRVLRGFRFFVTKRLEVDISTYKALESDLAADMLMKVSIERVREELERMFEYDTLSSLRVLSKLPLKIRMSIFRDGLRLAPTLKQL